MFCSAAEEVRNISRPDERPRPFLKWVGGKSQLLAEITQRIPQRYGRYFEPFVGGGAVFFSERPRKAVLIDVNEELANAYTVVRDDVDGLIKALRRHRYEKEYYYKIRNADRLPSFAGWDPVKRAARLIFLNKTCFNGLYRVNSKGQFNVPIGTYSNPTIVDAENLRACSQALAGVDIRHASFLTVEKLAKAGDFVYFDPPYAPLTMTSNFTSYSKDGFGAEEQQALRDLCLRLDKKGVSFLLSNSDAPLIRELYHKKKFRLATVYAARAVNSKGAKRGKIPELLISNV
jgi:DNA adenine methylase